MDTKGSGRRTGRSRGSGGDLLARITPVEAVGILRALLKRHPELREEAEELVELVATDVEIEDIAEEIEWAVLDLDVDELNNRAGEQPWGYVEPSEAAWEALEEAINPFLNDMKRQIDLGFEADAVCLCHGIVLGMYRVRGKGDGRLLAWAEDFPAEAAARAVETLAAESAAKRGRVWRLPETALADVVDWTGMLDRAARRR